MINAIATMITISAAATTPSTMSFFTRSAGGGGGGGGAGPGGAAGGGGGGGGGAGAPPRPPPGPGARLERRQHLADRHRQAAEIDRGARPPALRRQLVGVDQRRHGAPRRGDPQ